MPTNKDRADRACTIFQHYRDYAGYENDTDKDILPDILADLMHFCDEVHPPIGFDDALRVASMHHDSEVLQGDVMTCEEIKAVPGRAPSSALGPCGPEANASAVLYQANVQAKKVTCQCQNCSMKFADEDVLTDLDFSRRVEPGDIWPVGECPECGALCLPIEKEENHVLMPKGAQVLLNHIHRLLREAAAHEHRISELEVLVDQKSASLDEIHNRRAWICLYNGDERPEAEMVYCDRQPTFEEVIGAFEHLQERAQHGFIDAETLVIEEYYRVPTIKVTP